MLRYSTSSAAPIASVSRIEDLKSLITLYRGRSRSSRDVRAVAAQHLRRVEHKIRELKTIRGVLADLIERVPITTPIARSSQT